jgi:hypothetical protein
MTDRSALKGLSYDGLIMTGWGGMAHSEAEARQLIEQLKGQEHGTTASHL